MWTLHSMRYTLGICFLRLYCFLMGHAERMGCRENYEGPYCVRCGISYPQDKAELRKLLNRTLIFAVEYSALADRFFCWTSEKWPSRLPSWWEV